MRVIAGTARSMPLKTIEGLETRPTTDRIKETLFNILTGYVPQAKFLDLFAGSGGIGIEALSRGAESCTFVEQAKNAAACIEDNLKFTKLADKAQVRKFDAVSFVSSLPEVDYDVIFMDHVMPEMDGIETWQGVRAQSIRGAFHEEIHDRYPDCGGSCIRRGFLLCGCTWI